MSNVVAFRQPAEEIEPSTFDAAWHALTDTMRRRSEAKAKCEALWNREAKRLSGHVDLLARLRTYLRDDKDIPRTGGPGLQVVLRAGRLEHWTPMASEPRSVPPFANQIARAAVAAYRGEAFCRSYLDRCAVDGSTLVVPTEQSIIKLREVGVILKAHGFTGMRRREGLTKLASR